VGAKWLGQKSHPHRRRFTKPNQTKPCVLEDDEVNEEGRVIVDNLNAQAQAGINLHLNNYRFALYQMHARCLGYKGDRCLSPICVQGHVDKHFVEKGEKRTGFKPKAKQNVNICSGGTMKEVKLSYLLKPNAI